MPKRMFYRSAFDVWLTDHDIQNYTPPDEKLAYKVFAGIMAVGAILFFLLGIFGVQNILGAWGWYMLTIICLGYLLAFIPMVFKPDQRTLADISEELRLPVDADRSEAFWYERGVADTTFAQDSGKPPAEGTIESEERRE